MDSPSVTHDLAIITADEKRSAIFSRILHVLSHTTTHENEAVLRYLEHRARCCRGVGDTLVP
jgi:hypothetical protein